MFMVCRLYMGLGVSGDERETWKQRIFTSGIHYNRFELGLSHIVINIFDKS